VFGEFITKRRWLDAKKLYQGYAVSTLLLGVIVLILLSSLVSGAGVLTNANPLSTPFDLLAWASRSGSWLFLAGTLLIGVGLAPVFFDIEPFAKKYFAFTVLGVLMSIGAYYAYSASLVTPYLAVPVLLTLVANVLYFSRTRRIVTNKAVFIAILSVIIFSLQPLIYPKFVGQALSIDSLTASGPMVSVFYETTWVGWALLAAMLAIYFMAVARQKELPPR
jgi:hypothetical protein